MKSSTRASVMSTTHTAHDAHASHAAVWRLIPPTPRFCSLAPSVTTPLYSTTVSQALRGGVVSELPRIRLPKLFGKCLRRLNRESLEGQWDINGAFRSLAPPAELLFGPSPEFPNSFGSHSGE